MNFVIEALGLTAGGGKAGLMRLLPSLAEQGGHTFVALVADVPEFAALARPNLKLVMQKKPFSLLLRHLYLQRTVPRICAAERADALLCLGNFGPRRTPVPTVVVLHNARYVLSGAAEGAGATLRERLITRYGQRYLRRLPAGVRLVVQTDLMRRRVMMTHRVPGSRVVVIPDADALPAAAGLRHLTFAPADPRVGRAPSTLATAGPRPFTFLCLARYYPHKNLEVLAEAMKRLNASGRRPARCLLTIAADEHPGARRLLRKIATENLERVLVNLGPLSGAQVADAYASADAFILPTRLESFGRTYLEAMRFELPILTSDRDFARQMCGDAAIYFDPLDPGSVAASMARVMNDGPARARLAAESRRLAGRIPAWAEIAARFVSVLEGAAAGPAGEPSLAKDSAAAAAPPGWAASSGALQQGGW
ncbi:MAG TPA: glycosyltransferase [Terriglobia bacterium]|nr:glycosyltransferase [Terriglobia bacterium]